jgi:hypothetical protein
MIRKILILLAFTSCGWEISFAQTAQVSGKVVSAADKGIPGASVKLVSTADGAIGRTPETRLTDGGGNFKLSFDWSVVAQATQRGGTWQVTAEKTDYAQGYANVFLKQNGNPNDLKNLKIVLTPADNHDRLISKVDSCANPSSDARTLYVFDFANDSVPPVKLDKFQQLLGFKLQRGIRAKLESEGLLADFPFEIKTCREALVRDDSDALYVGKRLGCPGVIFGYIEESTNQLKSIVQFTALSDPAFTDMAPVVFSSELDSLLQPDQDVNGAYVAFSAFVLGELYLQNGRTNLAMKCFLRAKTDRPNSQLALQAAKILTALEQNNPAKNLTPVAAPHP